MDDRMGPGGGKHPVFFLQLIGKISEDSSPLNEERVFCNPLLQKYFYNA